jgi:cell division protein FtsI/penicillin-binding protein 2
VVRIRDVLAVLVGVAVVAAVGIGGWTWLSDSVEGDEAAEGEPGEDAEATAASYLDAWEAGDLRTMEELVRDAPEDFADRHRQLEAALEPAGFDIERGELASPVDGRASVPVTLSFELDEVEGPVTWESELELLRARGQWAVEWSLSTIHPELRPTWRFAVSSEPVDREPILAADGTPLSGAGQVVTFGFQPAMVEDDEEVVDAFADALPGSESTAERELGRGDLNDDWFYPVVTVSEARADAVSSRLRQASGILRRTEDGVRALLDDGFAQHVTGVIAEATAEQLEELEEELGDDLEPGVEVPQYGLELVFDDLLTGSDLVQVGLQDADDGEDGELRVVVAEGQADPSEPVETTIDVAVQRAIENTLADIEDPAAIVVVDGSSGAIVGSASRPLGGYNRAFSGRYPPGSTFKIVTAEAALSAGLNPGDELECPEETTVGGLRVPNAGDLDLGTSTLREAFARSCNTTFARLGAELGDEAISEAAERFGFGVEYELPLSSFGGSFPAPADTAEVGAASFGQARVEVSPLHLASVAAAVTTGTWHEPHLLVADEGEGERRSLATGTTEALQELMAATVTEGSGEDAAVDGEEVGGKTGTAQADGDVEHAWFAGTWEGLGFAILVEDGGAGSEVAAPLAGRLVEQLVTQTSDDVDPADPAGDGEDPAATPDDAETGGTDEGDGDGEGTDPDDDGNDDGNDDGDGDDEEEPQDADDGPTEVLPDG